jgi:predicted GNAT family N-acyltransferase
LAQVPLNKKPVSIMQIKCFPVTTEEEMQACLAIRHAVFVEEQNVPENEERDGQDDIASHFCVRAGGRVIGTCRIRFIGSAVKIERVAILKDFRGMGVGAVLMRYILQEVGKTGDIQLFKLSSQAQAVPFYERLGFKTRGHEYLDAGMPHYDMVLEKQTG